LDNAHLLGIPRSFKPFWHSKVVILCVWPNPNLINFVKPNPLFEII
jgi:hypothetical protein